MKKYNDVSYGTALADLYISNNRITCRDNIERDLRDYNNDDPEEILDYGEYVEMMGFTPVNGNYIDLVVVRFALDLDILAKSEKYTEIFENNKMPEPYISLEKLDQLLKGNSSHHIYAFDIPTGEPGDEFTHEYSTIAEAVKEANYDWDHLTLAEQNARHIGVWITDNTIDSDNIGISEIYTAE